MGRADAKIVGDVQEGLFFILANNGPRFSDYQSIEADRNGGARTEAFRAYPYVSSQKAANEYMSGQLRLHFSKDRPVDSVAEAKVKGRMRQ